MRSADEAELRCADTHTCTHTHTLTHTHAHARQRGGGAQKNASPLLFMLSLAQEKKSNRCPSPAPRPRSRPPPPPRSRRVHPPNIEIDNMAADETLITVEWCAVLISTCPEKYFASSVLPTAPSRHVVNPPHLRRPRSANRSGILLEMVTTLTEMGLLIRRATISSDGGWFVDGARACSPRLRNSPHAASYKMSLPQTALARSLLRDDGGGRQGGGGG